jgi:hypothetical protein
VKEKSMRRFVATLALFSLISALPAFGDERAPNVPSLRDRAAKVIRMIKKILLPAAQDAGDLSLPHP